MKKNRVTWNVLILLIKAMKKRFWKRIGRYFKIDLRKKGLKMKYWRYVNEIGIGEGRYEWEVNIRVMKEETL